MTKPRITLPRVTGFNEVVTLDLKEFGSKYVLWMICSFSRFMQGKLINNEKADTVIEALNVSWNYNDGLPSVGFFTDNRGEFANMKMVELTCKLGMTV